MSLEDTLSKNMKLQYELNAKIKALTEEKEALSMQNLALMQKLNMKRFTSEGLIIERRTNQRKVGVNENILGTFLSPEQISRLKVVPVDAITLGIKEKTLPPEASKAIITVESSEFVLVKHILPPKADKEQQTL